MSKQIIDNSVTMLQGMTLAEYSKFIANSSLVPKEYRGKPGDIFLTIDIGLELGLKPLVALQNIAVINGKPSVYGDAAIALVRSHPQFEDIQEYYDEKKQQAVCIIKRKGQSAHTKTFSVEDAKKARLWGKPGPWAQYPERMLQMRARGFAIRDVFSDALKGLITVEEAQDYPNERELKEKFYSTKADVINSKLNNVISMYNAQSDEKPKESEALDTLDGLDEVDHDVEFSDDHEKDQLLALIEKMDISQEIIDKWLHKAQVSDLSDLTNDQMRACVTYIYNNYGNQQSGI